MAEETSQTSIERVLGRLSSERNQLEATREVLANARAAPSSDWTRYWLAIAIIGVYALSVLGVLVFFGIQQLRCPGCVPGGFAAQMVDILKVVVLPVVTFMLGFYFGTGAISQGAKDAGKA